MHHPTDMIAHTTAFVTPVVEHQLLRTRNNSKGPPWRIDLTTHHTMSELSYHKATSRSLFTKMIHFKTSVFDVHFLLSYHTATTDYLQISILYWLLYTVLTFTFQCTDFESVYNLNHESKYYTVLILIQCTMWNMNLNTILYWFWFSVQFETWI